MKKIRLSESELVDLINNIYKSYLVEQYGDESTTEITSADDCEQNISKGPSGENVWRTMEESKKQEKIKLITNDIQRAITQCVNEYTQWFKNPETLKKFKNRRELDVVSKIGAYFKTIKKINITLKGPKKQPKAIAWVTPSKPTQINYNIPQFHDGNKYTQSVYEITKHEMGHLIDYYFKRNQIRTYNQTIDTSSDDDYITNYIINDSDQYARLNFLRNLIQAGPADSAEVLLSKFLKKVQDGTIKSTKYKFSGFKSKEKIQKNDTNTANLIYRKLFNSIFVNGKQSINLEQLFSTFAREKNGKIRVSFDLISNLNLTSKVLDKDYFYLLLTPIR